MMTTTFLGQNHVECEQTGGKQICFESELLLTLRAIQALEWMASDMLQDKSAAFGRSELLMQEVYASAKGWFRTTQMPSSEAPVK